MSDPFKGKSIYLVFYIWREADLNHRPSGYEPDELPDCSIPLCIIYNNITLVK